MKKLFALGLVCLSFVGCSATLRQQALNDAMASAYAACVADPSVQDAAKQAGMSSNQLCLLVMQAAQKGLQAAGADASAPSVQSACSDGSCPLPAKP